MLKFGQDVSCVFAHAAVAVQAGVCVDIFATNEYTDLASLMFLSIETGGMLLLYSSVVESTLPQDMYLMLNHQYAFNCVLPSRTSSEFKAGHYNADLTNANLKGASVEVANLEAAVAVHAGVFMDIFAVTNEYTDLASLTFLSSESRGTLSLYSNTDESTLPQDI